MSGPSKRFYHNETDYTLPGWNVSDEHLSSSNFDFFFIIFRVQYVDFDFQYVDMYLLMPVKLCVQNHAFQVHFSSGNCTAYEIK